MRLGGVLLWVTLAACAFSTVTRVAAQAGASTNAQTLAAAQVIEGTTYTNHTAHFILTVPADWTVTDELIKTTPDVVGTIKAPKGGVAIMMQRFDYPISAEATENILQGRFSQRFPGYHLIGEKPMKIEGENAASFTFQFEAPPGGAGGAPGEMFVVFIRNGTGVLEFMCEAPQTLFDQADTTFENIVNSYHYSASL